MSVTLGFGLITVLLFILEAFIVYQIGKIIKGRKEELDQVIKVLKRENRLEEDLTIIKSYIITSENIMHQIEKAFTEANDKDSISNKRKTK